MAWKHILLTTVPALWLAGCATTVPEMVEVPVAIYCTTTVPARPALPTDTLPTDANPFETAKALRAERLVLRAHVETLELALESCASRETPD